MRILESTIEFVAFSALLLETMTGHMASCDARSCSNDDSAVSLADESFKLVAKNGSKNTVFSPYSFAQILVLIVLGTGGKSESQIRKALECPYRYVRRRSRIEAGQLPIQQDNGSDGYEFEESDEKFKVEDAKVIEASAIFNAKSFVFKGSYKKTVKKISGVSPKSVDFTRPDVASREINRWIRLKTHNLIKEVIQPDDIDGDTRVVLTGTVYFNGSWVNSFDRDRTEMRPFYVNDGPARNVSTMTTTAEFNYGELPEIKAKFIELPYVTNPRHQSLSMFVIVPNSVDGIGELIRNVEKMNIRKLHGGKKRNIELTLPKFEIETTINLKEVAKSLGITDIFEDGADFSKMTSEDGLSVSKIVQKTVITVDERGTEAASVSGIAIGRSGSRYTAFDVNRPFIGIVANDVGVPHFTAVVADPSSKSSR